WKAVQPEAPAPPAPTIMTWEEKLQQLFVTQPDMSFNDVAAAINEEFPIAGLTPGKAASIYEKWHDKFMDLAPMEKEILKQVQAGLSDEKIIEMNPQMGLTPNVLKFVKTNLKKLDLLPDVPEV